MAGRLQTPAMPDHAAANQHRRLAAFDIMRGIGTFVVLIRHCGPAPQATPMWLRWPMDRIQHSGWMALESFFVLSGFLVGGLLFTEYKRRGELRVLPFLARRGAKIYPSFYLLFVLTLLFGDLAGRPVTTPHVLAEGLFYQNYRWGMWVHTWSLALEEHFYLLLPAVLCVLVWRSRRGAADPFRPLVWLYVLLALATLSLRTHAVLTSKPTFLTHFTPTHVRIDSLAIGALIAYLFHFRNEAVTAWMSQRRPLLWVAMGLLLAPSLVFDHLSPVTLTIGLPLGGWGIALLILLLLTKRPGETAVAKLPGDSSLAFIGRHSLGIYLWHQPVRHWGDAAIRGLLGRESTYWELAALTVIGGVLIGIALSRAVEFPVLKLRDRLLPSRAGSLVQSV